MALAPTRLEYRITLSQVDRARDATETVIVARHPSETQEHVTLRLLAWCLLHEDNLAFGPGLSVPDTADLWTHDATGRLTAWIECGTASAEKLRKTMAHHSGAQLHVVMGDEKATRELLADFAAERWPRSCPAPEIWTIDRALVTALAAREERRQKWAVTIVGDHFYIDVDGRTLNGAVTRATAEKSAS
ncbi:MAG: hypothetical protein JWN44_423 [Myxococcales bacterium]|nr:hypothetical protein [Myxococcales bacterium]